jgi:pimeloyl-ACP methyl ester carboxylesterase
MTGAAWLLAPLALGRGWEPSDAVVMLRALLNAELDGKLADVKAPTRVIAGVKVRGAPAEDVERLVAALPDARALLYPDMGHGSTMTSRRFADDVAAFLNMA